MSDIRYQAPPGTSVYWGEAKTRGIKSPTVINTSAQWDGENMSRSFLDRYAEGDHSPMRTGAFIMSYSVESQGGPARDQVKAWLEAHGENREPDRQEIVDWSLRWGNSSPPIEKADGKRHNPIPVKDDRFGHGETKQIDGLYYTNDLSQGSKGKIRFPFPVQPEVPVMPPTPPAEPEKPAPDALALVKQLRVDVNRLFREAERKAKSKP